MVIVRKASLSFSSEIVIQWSKEARHCIKLIIKKSKCTNKVIVFETDMKSRYILALVSYIELNTA